ncbi:hypothetical protein HZH66_010260 [Vespula vulgaris]|uniref:Uncharacterized protein n=1 Tax=Vespula vulgaris TaxID=7454 RepID=A0A834JIM6_VESVU|nr:hypothetical protein HZH66_010260 [Vespula vulgaris]
MSDTAFNKARTRLCKPQVMLVHYAAPRENNSTDFPWSAVVSGDNRLPADDLEIAILSEVTVHRKQDSTVKKLQKTDRRSIRILFESRLEPTKTRPSFLVSEKSLLKNSADSPVDVLSRGSRKKKKLISPRNIPFCSSCLRNGGKEEGEEEDEGEEDEEEDEEDGEEEEEVGEKDDEEEMRSGGS